MPKVGRVPGELDVDAMIKRFQARARAVRQRGMPPIEGPERKRFVDQARIDFQDYAIIGDAVGHLDGGVLTLTVDLRSKAEADQPESADDTSASAETDAETDRPE